MTEVSVARYISTPKRAAVIRGWLAEERRGGTRISWIEVTGTNIHSFVLHGDFLALRRFRKDSHKLGARIG